MASQHQYYSDNYSLGVGNMEPNQNNKRASLLAGLRTGGPRANSPAPAYGQDQFQHNQHMNQGYIDQAQLKATAAVFTPRTNSTHSSPEHELPNGHFMGQGVSINERAALMQQHHNQHQQIQNAQAQLAALYGAGQGHGLINEHAQQQEQLLMQQKNAQLLQNQLAAQQQLELLRLQAVQQQQAQQQQVQAQQRALLARIQAEYERQAHLAALAQRQEEIQDALAQQAANARLHQQQQQQQTQSQHGSAREQRQAAQASIQASLRNRRDEQFHAQQQMLMQQLRGFNDVQAGGYDGAHMMSPPPASQVQHGHGVNGLTHQQQLELETLMRSINLAQQQPEDDRSHHAQNMSMHQMQRTQSPPTMADSGREGANNKQRDRMSSHADASASWRSSLGAMAGVAALRKNSNTPPSIVIDDSDSEYSMSRSSIDMRRGLGSGRSALGSVNRSEPDTPETSEEDLVSFPSHLAKVQGGAHVLSKVGSDEPAVLPSGQLNSKPTNVIRSSALAGLLGNVAAAQRNRSDSSSGGLASLPPRPVLALNGAHTGGNGRVPSPPTDSFLLGTGTGTGSALQYSHGFNTQGSNAVSAPRRQPKGPPTEFLAHNFASRITLRTRREAMSKLCASPRASALSFAGPGLPRPTPA